MQQQQGLLALDSFAFEKQIVAADRVLPTPQILLAREKDPKQLQLQTPLVISTGTPLCLRGAEVGVQRGGDKLSVILGC